MNKIGTVFRSAQRISCNTRHVKTIGNSMNRLFGVNVSSNMNSSNISMIGSFRSFSGHANPSTDINESAVISDKPSDDDDDDLGMELGADGIHRNRKDINAPPSAKLNVLVDKILDLDIIEMNQLLNRLQKRLGITDEMIMSRGHGGGGGGGSGGGAAAAEAVVEKTAFDVKLTGYAANAKIKVIKEVRAATSLGLKEAKELVEGIPCNIKEGLTKEESEALKEALVAIGAEVEIV